MHVGTVRIHNCRYIICLQAFTWHISAIRRAQALFGGFGRRSLTMSSAYSGIGTVEQAAHQICSALPGYVCTPAWALEKDTTCKAELVSWFRCIGHHQACVFGNLKDLVPECWYHDLGFGKDAVELPPSALYEKGLHNADVFTQTRSCASHTGRVCHLTHTDIHVAGTTCVDHSNYGKMKRDQGKHVKCFLIWAALMKKVRPNLILHENVAGFGTKALFEALGELYIICPSVSCASRIGYPIRRKRQMCILVLKSWIYPQLRAAGMHKCCNPSNVIQLVDLQATLDMISLRPCHLAWSDFLADTDADLNVEIAEARARPGVR